MQLIDLECVLAVADRGGFTAGAEAVNISQPALSKRIAALERELGALLFHRAGHRVSLTPAGEACCEAARETLRHADAVRQAVAGVAGLRGGRLDLVTLPTLSVSELAPLIGEFRDRYPAVTIRAIGVEDAETVAAVVASARGDLGIADLAAVGAGLVVEPLFEQELLAVAPPGAEAWIDADGDEASRTHEPPGPSPHRRRRIKAIQLVGHPLVTMPSGASTRSMLDELYTRMGTVPVVAVETNQRQAIVPLVLAGAGFTILPEPLAEEAAARGAAIASFDPPLRRTIALYTRSGAPTAAARAFLELLRDAHRQ